MENIEVLKTPAEVNERVKALGAEISTAYNGAPLTMLVVMNGGLFFAAKLAEAIDNENLFVDSMTSLVYIFFPIKSFYLQVY